MPRLYNALSTIIDYSIIILIYTLVGSIVFVFVKPEDLFKLPITWIVFGSISWYTLLKFKDAMNKDNSIWKKICAKIIKDKNRTISITEITLFLIILMILELILKALFRK